MGGSDGIVHTDAGPAGNSRPSTVNADTAVGIVPPGTTFDSGVEPQPDIASTAIVIVSQRIDVQTLIELDAPNEPEANSR